ncbi:MAG: hypothetical protein ABIH24_04215, partial [Verrucomicrobiota bacterium]
TLILHEHQRYDGFYSIKMACKLFFAPLSLLTQRGMKEFCKNADVRLKRRSRDFGASATLARAWSMLIHRRPCRLAYAPNLRDAKIRFDNARGPERSRTGNPPLPKGNGETHATGSFIGN